MYRRYRLRILSSFFLRYVPIFLGEEKKNKKRADWKRKERKRNYLPKFAQLNLRDAIFRLLITNKKTSDNDKEKKNGTFVRDRMFRVTPS